MKATITKTGVLFINAENDLECFALNHWLKDNIKSNSISPENLLFNASGEFMSEDDVLAYQKISKEQLSEINKNKAE